MFPTLLIILPLVLACAYLIGVHGSASIVATVISSRALGPRQAMMMAVVGMCVGPFLFGAAVANTLVNELVTTQAVTAQVIIAALIGALLWSAITTWLRIPSTISQALIGALVGAALAGYGSGALIMDGLVKALAGLFLSPVLGLLVGFFVVRLFYWLSAAASPHINLWYKRGQVLAALLMAVSFGANNGQKIVGVVMLGLIATGFLHLSAVPTWVIVFSALGMAIGAVVGGWRLIHTLGGKFYKIRPIHGFSAQVASGAVITTASLLGGPVSGTQVITSAIVGAGGADRIQQVRWSVMQNIAIGWLLTMPISALIGALAYHLIEGTML
jgi:PiT family inorganic phosphate transporter